MAQYLSQTLSPQMRMEQRLTPQLIQAMAVLQKPVAELEAFVNDALENNAALEVAERDGHAPTQPPAGEPPRTDRAATEGERLNWWERFSRKYELDADDRAPIRRPSGGTDETDAKLAAMANSPGREGGLLEHLLSQWGLLELSPEVRRAGEVIINQLDPDGYLRIPTDEILARIRPPVSREVFEDALDEVQHLDPPGVGARDLVECLLFQLDTLPGNNQVEFVLIEQHLEDIAQNRLPAIAKATGYSLGEIQEALNVIRTLHPQPGYLVGDRSEPPIRPDIIVDYADTGGGLTVRLARGNVPPLRISESVAAMAKSRESGREQREFARKQVEAAAAIIDAVQYRQNRLLEVGRAIVEKQRDFFDIGPDGLRVLRMTDVAQELNCDPSTISRTVADKYMQTPRGIFPLRYFFTGGRETDDGESVGWDRVKSRVKELVEKEDRKAPLKDDQIADLLRKEGLDISRRTVAKYRQQLNIANARQRQEY